METLKYKQNKEALALNDRHDCLTVADLGAISIKLRIHCTPKVDTVKPVMTTSTFACKKTIINMGTWLFS